MSSNRDKSLSALRIRLRRIYHLEHNIGYPTVTLFFLSHKPITSCNTSDVLDITLGLRLHHFHLRSFGYSDVITVSINFNGSTNNNSLIAEGMHKVEEDFEGLPGSAAVGHGSTGRRSTGQRQSFPGYIDTI